MRRGGTTRSGTGSPSGSLTAAPWWCTTRGGWAGSCSTLTSRDLGPDAATIAPGALAAALQGSAAPIKARLLDQSRVAGVGNLIADETLWRAGLSPLRPAGSLSPAEVRRLHRHLRRTLGDLTDRGGSHLGDLMEERHPGGRCPRDGAELVRSTVGGRTSWWCPSHQG